MYSNSRELLMNVCKIKAWPIPCKGFFVLFIFSLVWMYFVYSPTVNIPFANHDQYRYFVPKTSSPTSEPQFIWLFLITGRPLSALIEQLIFRFTHTLNDLTIIRLIAIILTGFLVTLFSNWLSSNQKFSKIEAFCISIAVFTLPGIQNFIIMTNVSNLTAITLAFLSYLSIIKIDEFSIKGYLPSAALLLGSLFIYPALTFFFFVPLLIRLLLSDKESISKEIKLTFRAIAFVIINCIIYYALVKCVLHTIYNFYHNINAVQPDYNFNLLNIPIFFAIMNLLKRVYPMASSFWIFHTSLPLLILGGLIPFIFLSIKIKEITKIIKNKNRWIIPLLLMFQIIIFFAAGSFTFLIKPYFPILYRTLFVLSAMLLVLMLISIFYLSDRGFPSLTKYFRIITCFLLLIIPSILANRNVAHTALNANMEINHIITTIRKSNLKNPEKIHFRIPQRVEYGYNGQRCIGDEFNFCSANSALSKASFYYIAACALSQMHYKMPDCSNISISFIEDPLPIIEDTVVINMEILGNDPK